MHASMIKHFLCEPRRFEGVISGNARPWPTISANLRSHCDHLSYFFCLFSVVENLNRVLVFCLTSCSV